MKTGRLEAPVAVNR